MANKETLVLFYFELISHLGMTESAVSVIEMTHLYDVRWSFYPLRLKNTINSIVSNRNFLLNFYLYLGPKIHRPKWSFSILIPPLFVQFIFCGNFESEMNKR